MRLLLLAALCGIALAIPETYHWYKVLRFHPNEDQLNLLRQFENAPGFDFWNDVHRIGDFLDIMVAPEQQAHFLKFLEDQNISYNILHNNVQE
ncbi:Zinc carboxypeptidase A 1 [Blattella germanica]|nr:Zinc carboxypeptidase A 1 [Blattella germanica]